MSEPALEQYREISRIFIEKYNNNSDTNFVLEEICDEKNDEDYDCVGGSGDGPNYTGTVQVFGPDEFGLDRDRDGVRCE